MLFWLGDKTAPYLSQIKTFHEAQGRGKMELFPLAKIRTLLNYQPFYFCGPLHALRNSFFTSRQVMIAYYEIQTRENHFNCFI